jgi:5'-nucleotidase (lipoprotein e(P4) family)
MKNIMVIFVLVSVALISCNNNCNHKSEIAESQDYLINSVLWYQCSGEMRASYYQAFMLAELMIENNLNKDTSAKPAAVVLDIDETLLDNSNFNGFMILENTSFNQEDWFKWTKKAEANALPGAIEFLNFVKELDVEIFYISNRMEEELSQTITNMDSLGFPETRPEHFLLKSTTSNKFDRRNIILENYNVILYVGDNLGDFSNDFDERTNNYAFEAVDANKELFGTQYIILPNPMYGTWEKGVLTGEGDKNEQRKSHIRGF